MIELIQTKITSATARGRLLATACAASLLSFSATAAAGEDQPSVWIEIGGQLERVDGGQLPFAPPFTLISPTPDPYRPISPAQAQHPARNSYGAEGRLSFTPHNSDWVFSAALRYGRSNNRKSVHQQTLLPSVTIPITPDYTFYKNILPQKFAHTDARNHESHSVIDFSVGRDVGLGIFGAHGSSIAGFGIRFAQFESRSDVSIYARPDLRLVAGGRIGPFAVPLKYFTDFNAQAENSRSFLGIGPSLAWNASARLGGNGEVGEIDFDWGINGAILFGRQKATGNHTTIAYSYAQAAFNPHPPTGRPQTNGRGYATAYQHDLKHNRSRSVTVPNFGAFVGVSFRHANAKVTFGYRGDFFLGAIDDGVDIKHTVDRNFYGPFARVSIGLGE